MIEEGRVLGVVCHPDRDLVIQIVRFFDYLDDDIVEIAILDIFKQAELIDDMG